MKTLNISPQDEGVRLDSFLFRHHPDYSRSYFNALIKDQTVQVNGGPSKSSYHVKAGDIIEFDLIEKPQPKLVEAENIPLSIVFQNDDVVIIDKPAGLVVHPAPGHPTGTLVNALAHSFPLITTAVYEDSNELSMSRPGLVHRLDKETSGIMIVAKNIKTMIFLARQIKNRKAKKIYLALCAGWPKNPRGKLINHLGRSSKDRKSYTEVGLEKGREAISDYQTVENFLTPQQERVSLLKFEIKTGRTHQIRTQAKMAGFPVIGDDLYSTKESSSVSEHLGAKRQMLHAKSLSITLPKDGKARIFDAPLPADFTQILNKLRS